MTLTIKKRKVWYLPDVPTQHPGRRLGGQILAWSANLGKALLIDLSNLKPEDLKSFWRRWGYLYEAALTDAEVLEIADGLRQIWRMEVAAPLILQRWLTWTTPSSTGWAAPIWCFMPEQSLLILNPGHLRATLAFAVPGQCRKFAVCQNQACPAPYFLRYRAKQSVCDNPQCLEFGQKQHKRTWWVRNRGRKTKGTKR